MFCMYCGDQTQNINHVCDECEKEAQRIDALAQCTSGSLREKLLIL